MLNTMKSVLIALALALVAPVTAQPAPKNPARLTPSVITNPGTEFQDNARPGAMVIGTDRTPTRIICPARAAGRNLASRRTRLLAIHREVLASR